MADERLRLEITPSSLDVLSIIQGQHSGNDLSLSGAVNLVAQLAGIIARTPLPLTTGELLYCCDILNGGASMTEFKAPDQVSITEALDGMKHSLQDGTDEPEICEKWGIDAQKIITKLELMEIPALFALAYATRQFWSGKAMWGIKALKDCDGHHEWAGQWVDAG